MLYRHALLFEDMEGEYNVPLAANAKSVRDFDEGLTRGMALICDVHFEKRMGQKGVGIGSIMKHYFLTNLSMSHCSFLWFQVSG